MKHLQPWLACLFVPLAPLAQADITVLPDGSVGPVVGLEQALAMAQPGETLYLMPGDYAGATVDARSVRIVGAGVEWVTIGTLPGAAEATPMVIANLDRSQQVLLSGVTLSSPAGEFDMLPLEVTQCRGLVSLQDLDLRAIGTGALSLPGVGLFQSDAVVLDRCKVQGATAASPSAGYGGYGANVTGARVFFNHCEVLGGLGYTPSGVLNGYPGIYSGVADLHVHGGSIRGGSLAAAASFIGPPGAGIEMLGGEVFVSGDESSLIRGGDVPGPTGVPTDGGSAITGSLGLLTVYGGVRLEGGLGSEGEFAPPLTLSGVHLERYFGGQHRPGVKIEPSSGSPGDGFLLEVQGTPGRLQTVVVGRDLTLPFKLGGHAGLAFLELGAAVVTQSLTADAAGVASIHVSTPLAAELAGSTIWYQSFEVQDPDGKPRLGLPAGYRFH